MTLPDERANSMLEAKKLLWGLAYDLKKIPKEVREQAKRILRHYPWELDIEKMAKCCPDLLEVNNVNHDKT